MELPQYTLRPNTNRMVVPWVLKLLGLAILFYAGIYLNIRFVAKYLRISFLSNAEIPAYVNLLIFAFLIVLVVTQVILYRVKFGKFKYSFYTNRVEFEGKKTETFMFTEFQQAELKQNLFDRMFDTGSIRLSRSFSIGPVSGVSQVKAYLEQLVKYHLSMQERYRVQQQQVAMQREVAQQAAAQSSAPAQQPVQYSAPQPSPRPSPQPQGVFGVSEGVQK
jgi:hypothetical protein